MWVVKLGGSLFDSDDLVDWLKVLANSPLATVVVPGGGPFADQVRQAQSRWGFNDVAAHRMAVYGMQQMGEMLCAIQPGFTRVDARETIKVAADKRRAAMWLPEKMVLAAAEIPCDWTVTSDSLALWLAGQINADGVVLVKSVTLDDVSNQIDELQRADLIDQAAHHFTADLACPVLMLHRSHSALFERVVQDRRAPAVQLAC